MARSGRFAVKPGKTKIHLPPLMPELAVYLVLLALGAASLSLAYLPVLGFNLSICLVMATVMVVIVLATFMELRRATALLLLTAISAVMWLSILFTLTLADYATRPQGTGETLRIGRLETKG